MNRKYNLKNRRRFYIFVLLLTITLTSIIFATTVNGADTNAKIITVTVAQGDTLWTIAKTYHQDGDVRQYIRKIQKLNDLSDSDIFVGDILKLPA